MFDWNEKELANFFGRASYDVRCESYSFKMHRDGLRLLVTLFPDEGAVYASIYRDGLPKPLCTICREVCTHVHITQDVHSRKCFEAGSPEHPVTEMAIPPLLIRGLRVYVEPQFQIETIQPRCEKD